LDNKTKHEGSEIGTCSFFKDQLSFYLLIVLSFFPIMPYGVMSAAILLFLATCVITNFQNFNNQYHKVGLIPFVINAAFFLALALTLVYSENLKFGWRQIERGLPLLLFPLIFLYFPPKLTKKQLRIVLGTFVLANLVFIGYLFSYLVNNASDFKIPEQEELVLFEGLKNKGFFTQLKDLWNGTFYEVLYYAQKNKESWLEIHKTYASQGILWSIVIVAFFFANKRVTLFKKSIQLLVLLVLLIVLVYLYSMMNLLVLVLLSPLLLYAIIGPTKYRKWYAFGSLIVAFGLLFTITFGQRLSSNSYEKYKQYENPIFVFSNIKKMLQKDERNGINECNIKVLKESPIFGHGVGDVQDLLDECYSGIADETTKGPSIGEQHLNSHNYYAFLGLSGGVLLVILFLALLGFNASLAVRKKDLIYLAFIGIVAMNLITENTLGRAHGILFFALFNSMLLSKNLSGDTNDR